MKKTTFFSLLTMLFLFLGGNAWADTYSHTFVTTDIPENTTDTQFTLSDVDWTLALDGGKVSVFSNDQGTHFGTNNATCNSVTLSTEGISGTITSITVEASRGANLQGALTVKVGDFEFTTDGDTGLTTTNTAYEFTGTASGEVAIVWTKTGGKGAFYIKSITIDYGEGGVVVAKPVITPAGGTFTEAQEVTITSEGNTIYYTTDGNDPTNESTQYAAPFTVDTDCTVKAIAYDAAGNASGIAKAEFTFISGAAITNIADLCAAAPESGSEDVLVEFNNWICTGAKGTSNAYFTDGRNGILLYEKNHGFELGDQLTGSAMIKVTTYKECAEITGLSSTTEGVTITKGATAEAMTVVIGDLEKNMQGNVISLKGVTYNATDKVMVDDDDNRITPYGTFTTLPELQDGAVYDVTGVAIWFVPNNAAGYWEIAPRTADEIQLSAGVVVVTKPTISPDGGTFAEPQTVTITADEGCAIFYTLDGTDPTDESTQYAAPFTVDTDCTVKAIAYDADGNASAVASADFAFVSGTAIANIADLCAAAPEEGNVDVLVEFNNWICTGVKGGQAFFTDGANGIVAYKSGHGFEVGDVLTGSAVVTLTTYNECAEITSLTAETEGVTVTKGEGATPMTVAIADLEKNMQGCLLYFEGLTYSGGVFVDDDDNPITPYGTFIKLPELLEGKTYNVTGVAIWFKNSQVWEIAPRTADEIQLITSQIAPVSAWSVESEVVDLTGTPTAVFRTDSDGEVTYESSNEEVAIIDSEGNITPMGKGVTTITAFVAETETYLPDSKSFTLTVTVEGYADVTFTYNDEDIVGQGAPDTGAELTAIRNDVLTLYANKAYAKSGDTHIKFYGSKYEGKDEERVLTEPSYIRLSVPEGYAITNIVMTATGESYIKEWKDQYNTAVTIEGATATWEGLSEEVILTNQATAQARIKTITVTYADPDAVGISTLVETAEKTTATYNLAGQMVNGPLSRGIYIVGGKKIVVK